MYKIIAFLLCCVALTSACVPYDGQTGVGYITVCKPIGECFTVSSTRRTCVNFIGGPFHTGNSGRNTYYCKVFSQQGCKGNWFAVGSSRVSFPWRALSYSCPWKC